MIRKYRFLAIVAILMITAFFIRANGNTIGKELEIIGHRGAAGLSPENTIESIGKAIEHGGDYVEIDIHLSKDDYLIVCHNKTINATTNGKGKIRNLTKDEILSYYIKSDTGELTSLKIPTLNEVFEFARGKIKLLIEIKKQPRQGEIEVLLVEIINKYDATKWVVVQSFSDSILEKMHSISPEIRLEKLLLFKFPGLPLIFDGGFSKFSKEKYRHISSFNILHSAATSAFVNQARSMGKEVKIFTLDDPSQMPRNVIIDGVITDRPDLWK